MTTRPDIWRNIPDDFRTWLEIFMNRTEFNSLSIIERAELRERFERHAERLERSRREDAERLERSRREDAERLERSRREGAERLERSRREGAESLDRPKRDDAQEGRAREMQSMMQLMMASRVDPYAVVSTSHNSRDDSLAVRNESVEYYGLEDENFCQVLGAVTSRNVSVINAHIWPRHAAADLFIFDLKPDQVRSPQNVLRLQSEIKRAFDNRRLTFVTANHDCDDKAIFAVKVLDPSAKDEPLNGTDMTLSGIDGKVLQLPNGNPPFRRLLANHSVLAHKKARVRGWIGQDLSEIEANAEALLAHSLDSDARFRLKTLWGKH